MYSCNVIGEDEDCKAGGAEFFFLGLIATTRKPVACDAAI